MKERGQEENEGEDKKRMKERKQEENEGKETRRV